MASIRDAAEKLDLEDAYWMVLVYPIDQHLLGISWTGEVYVDDALPRGVCSSLKIIMAAADAME